MPFGGMSYPVSCDGFNQRSFDEGIFFVFRPTELSGGALPGAKRIDGYCWLDGNMIVEFWAFPGSIARTVYDRGTTAHRTEFLSVASEAYRRLRPAADANVESAWYSI